MTFEKQELPPFVRTWNQLYALVLGSLVAEISIFYALMAWLS